MSSQRCNQFRLLTRSTSSRWHYKGWGSVWYLQWLGLLVVWFLLETALHSSFACSWLLRAYIDWAGYLLTKFVGGSEVLFVCLTVGVASVSSIEEKTLTINWIRVCRYKLAYVKLTIGSLTRSRTQKKCGWISSCSASLRRYFWGGDCQSTQPGRGLA